MHVIVERAELNRAVKTAARDVARTAPVSIMEHLRLSAAAGGLAVTGTTYDQRTTATAAADVRAAGEACMSAHKLAAFVGALPDGAQVEIRVENDTARVHSGRARLTLPTLPAADFIPDWGPDAPAVVTLPAKVLAHLFASTAHATGREETRRYLTGCYLHPAERAGAPVLRTVAMDGHRGEITDAALPDGGGALPSVIVPNAAVAAFQKVLADVDGGDATLAVWDAGIRLGLPGVTLQSKLIDATYPDYTRVIPAQSDVRLTVAPAGLAAAVRRVRAAADRDKGDSRVRLDVEAGFVTVSAEGGNGERAEDAVESHADLGGAGTVEMFVNARYLLDALAGFPGDAVAIRFDNPAGTPVVFTDPADDAHMTIVMPLRG